MRCARYGRREKLQLFLKSRTAPLVLRVRVRAPQSTVGGNGDFSKLASSFTKRTPHVKASRGDDRILYL